MPSKGGPRGQGIGSGMVAMAGGSIGTVAPAPTAFTFSATELGRPLRRGFEVERFNELARRQEELAPQESDELYGYRLRRLQARLRRLDRVRASDDEEAIREALDDLDGRLQELRRFEESRQLAGLPSAYEVELSAQQAATDRLLDLARCRPFGLIAGSDTAPEQPAGDVRLPEVAFQPSAEDVPVYILAPPSIPSDALVRNVEAVANEGAHVWLVHEASQVPRNGEQVPLVLNWGRSDSLPADLVALNRPEAVRIASDQVESLRRLSDLAPKTVLRPDDLNLLGSERVVAKQRHGARGRGKAVISLDAAWSERCRYDLFQQLVGRHREYRVSLLSGQVVSAYLKRPPAGTLDEDLRPNWSFERADVLPRSVVSAAREGARRVDLDYCGVDVIEDGDGRVYCLEVNAAPGMSEHTLRNLYTHVQRTVRGQFGVAS